MRSTINIGFVFFLIGLLWSCIDLKPPKCYSTVTGIVRDSLTGEPIAGIDVYMHDHACGGIGCLICPKCFSYTVITNKDGLYTVKGEVLCDEPSYVSFISHAYYKPTDDEYEIQRGLNELNVSLVRYP